jgi:hypothetical protein
VTGIVALDDRDDPVPVERPAGRLAQRSRSGAIRGWWSARTPSQVISPRGSGCSTSMASTANGTRASHSTTSRSGAPSSSSSQFTVEDGPGAFPGRRVALVEGPSLTWSGPSLVTARSDLVSDRCGLPLSEPFLLVSVSIHSERTVPSPSAGRLSWDVTDACHQERGAGPGTRASGGRSSSTAGTPATLAGEGWRACSASSTSSLRTSVDWSMSAARRRTCLSEMPSLSTFCCIGPALVGRRDSSEDA